MKIDAIVICNVSKVESLQWANGWGFIVLDMI